MKEKDGKHRHGKDQHDHPMEGRHFGGKEKHRGAKTFRRGRAIEFLNRMNIRRDTLQKQLQSPEFQTINPILVGELKAIETMINEFVHLFEINEEEMKAPEVNENPAVDENSIQE